jgi:hypothetical protein
MLESITIKGFNISMTVICHDTSCIRRDISHACNVSNTVCRLICMFSKWMRDQCLTFSEQLFMQCTRTMSFVGYVVLAHRNCNLNEAMVDTLPWKQQSNWSHGRYIILTKFYNFWLNTEAKIYSVLVRGFWSTSKHVLLECLWPYKAWSTYNSGCKLCIPIKKLTISIHCI